MTAIQYVSQRGMQEKTGLKGALGYALPKEDKILIRKGLSEEKKKEVLAHEEEHIAKGEEGPFWGAVIGAGASLLGGVLGSSSAKKAAKASERAAEAQIGFARESRDLVRQDNAPFQSASYTALNALMGLAGLPVSDEISNAASGTRLSEIETRVPYKTSGKATTYEVVNAFQEFAGRRPTKGEIKYYTDRERADQLYGDVIAQGLKARQAALTASSPASPASPAKTPDEMLRSDPGYEFRYNEGIRASDRSAAAGGGLLSGGYGRKLTRYGQDYASNEYMNLFNRIATIAGYGQVANQNNYGAAVNYGQLAAGAAGNAGDTRASAYTAQGNSWANAINQVGKSVGALDFRRNRGGGGFDPNGMVGYDNVFPGYEG